MERALSLIKPGGMVGLLTPSGIASDKTASRFFRSISTTGRLAALLDFENRKVFFPDVHASFKFCALIIGGASRALGSAKCGFFLRAASEASDPLKSFELSAADFALVNPNTGTAPVFRTRRDAELTTAIYRRAPVLVNRSGGTPRAVWPVRYSTMFHMTNDSHLFLTRSSLEASAYPIGGNRWKRGEEEFVPLYVGRMIHQFDHRAASVRVNPENLHNPALSGEITEEEHADPSFLPTPQFWVSESTIEWPPNIEWGIAFRDIARSTDARTMIATIIPRVAAGNTLPLVQTSSLDTLARFREFAPQFVATFGSLVFDYVTRQKAQSTHLNWYIVEQLPVLPADAYARRFGPKSAAEIVKAEVLALTYTAHDMEPFARDMGYEGPPFRWDADDRLRRRAKLDALYFLLYGVTDRDEVRYIYSTFPIVEREETAAHGRYLSRDLCLLYMNALEAGDPDAEIVV